MTHYRNYCDEFYVNMNLSTEMELPTNRDTLLHFFEQLQKRYPTMRNFYSRERDEYILEEDKDSGSYRWSTVDPKRICSGYVNPPTMEDATSQHQLVLESVPYTLSVSPLDCESLNFMFGFDFTYRGNHHKLLADALGIPPAFEKLMDSPDRRLVSYEPMLQFALDEDCRTQCRLSIETRTNAYQIRTGEFPEEQLSVYLTMRHYGSMSGKDALTSTLQKLQTLGTEILESHVVENVLVPLRQTIAIK